MSQPVFTFGSFELHPVQRQLLEAGSPVRLGSRALDILVALTRRAGEVVSKDELIAEVWPGLVVEETNLRVHVAALRKALGDGNAGNRFITNVPGRGYSFVAPIVEKMPEELPAVVEAPPAPLPSAASSLPVPLTRIHGRTEVIRALATQLPQRRLITIAGPGGIGKTTVALAAAESRAPSCADGAVFVDLALVADPPLVPCAVAAALGLSPRTDGFIPRLVSFLRDKAMLLVLDSCEHVVEAAATLVEALLKAAPGLAILATSREPLRAEGEWVQRLEPLGVPPAAAPLTAAEAMRFPAVQLFVERASGSLGGFELTDAEAPVVADICRRLDGIALAIEFAAGRLDAFGLRELATLLDDRFQVLTRGRRTALPRHQTLRATLDWSYSILSEAERAILRRLSIFSGGFTLAAARKVAGGMAPATLMDFGDDLASLVGKSLVTAEVNGAEPQYRLLETTRAYARDKLGESGEMTEIARRHAEYHRRLFEQAEAEWETRPTGEWLADYTRRIPDLRAALNWAFGGQGDSAIGVALTVASVPLWFQLSRVDECLACVERALAMAMADAAAPAPAERRRRMKLHAALGWLQMYAADRIESGAAAWRTALELAEELGDRDYQVRALWALWADRMNRADFREGLRLAERFRDLPAVGRAEDTTDRLVGERMMGAALHFLGDQAAAREHIERMLLRYAAPRHRSHAVRFQFDQRATARITLARVLWLQGLPDRALREVAENVEQAIALDHTMSLCNVLAQAACPVALLSGDLEAAKRYATMLRDHAAAEALDVWRAYADGFEGEILIRGGQAEAGLRLVATAVDTLRRAGFVQYLTAFSAALAQGLFSAGRAAEGLAVVDEALARCEASDERWAVAELKRIRAEAMLRGAGEDVSGVAETLLLESLQLAREQQALSWELRTATSLAELWRKQGFGRKARDVLAPVWVRFAEGFGTEDLVKAAAVLELLDAETITAAPACRLSG